MINPKRRLREARKQSQISGIGTKSQQALQLQREENKLERKVISREMKEAEKQRQFELEQQKRKDILSNSYLQLITTSFTLHNTDKFR